jgi:UDP-glucuronate 4-epimerase
VPWGRGRGRRGEGAELLRVVVTGAAGFIGSHVSEALVARGDDVVGVDNFDPFYARAVKERNLEALRREPRFRLVEGDIARDPIPLEGASAVIHLAARPGVRPSLEDAAGYVDANVRGTACLLEAARRAGVARLVLGSSSSVYGDDTPPPFAETASAGAPISPYAATKRSAELLAHAFAHLYPLRVVCLRFFTVYGPRQRPDLAIHRFTERIARGLPIRMHGDGSSERDYTYISDAVDGVLAALTRTEGEGEGGGGAAFEVLNIGGGARVRLDRLIALIGVALSREPTIQRHPDQPGDVRLTAADLRAAERALGYRPRIGIEEGIRSFVRWYEETHGRQS